MPNASEQVVVNTDRASVPYYVDVLRVTLERLQWKNVTSGPPLAGTHIVWSEDPTRKPRLLALPHGARTNRFFAMVRVCRKVCLAIMLDACERLFPDLFASLAPNTWWIGRAAVGWDAQLEHHRRHCEETPHGASAAKAFIVKPDNGCQGAGIQLVRGHEELRALLAREDAPERAVVQSYMPDPLLVDGLKFDLRLYVVVTCSSPLQAYLSTRGVARFASHPWKPVDATNQADMLMHLSNSSINQAASGVTNKWELPRLWKHLVSRGVDVDALWERIRRLVALTLAAMQPTVAHAYSNAFATPFAPRRAAPKASTQNPPNGGLRRVTVGYPTHDAQDLTGADSEAADGSSTGKENLQPRTGRPGEGAVETADAIVRPEAHARRSFQILGFDVMLDAGLKPWLLEVNHSPSMALSGNEQEEVDAKCSVVTAALRLGHSDEHCASLCEQCEVMPLHHIAWPLCALEPVRRLFEAHVTSRSAQQWTMNIGAFERLVQPCLDRILQPEESDEPMQAIEPIDLRELFLASCSARADVGSGWDVAAAGQMTLWAFTEAMLRLAERTRAARRSSARSEAGLAASLAHVVSCLAAADSS